MSEINLETSQLGFCSLNDVLYFKDHGIVKRNDEEQLEQVALISGGGAGHEPGFAGFVGQGMLSVAVSGSVFTSPSVTRCGRNYFIF